MTSPLQTIWAFIDESGNLSLETERDGVSNFYVCVAVRVTDANLETANETMLAISRDEFSGAEVKSHRIGGNHRRRLRILELIQDVEFSYVAVIVDKTRLYRDSGFQWQSTFYKYFHRFLYTELQKGNINLEIRSDDFGRTEFQEGFEKYLRDNHPPDLYSRWDHKFGDSREYPLVQLADLIAGSLTYCFDPDKRSDYSGQFRDLLKTKELQVKLWPLDIIPLPELSPDESGEYDDAVRHNNVTEALKFISTHEESEDEDRLRQVAVLQRLLFGITFEDDQGSIIGLRLMEHLDRLDLPVPSDRELRKAVIGPLRDYGLIITGRQDGYRLATSMSDIERYVRHDATIIIPMLKRLQRARVAAKNYTDNQYEILDGDHNLPLRTVLEAITELDLDRLSIDDEEDEE